NGSVGGLQSAVCSKVGGVGCALHASGGQGRRLHDPPSLAAIPLRLFVSQPLRLSPFVAPSLSHPTPPTLPIITRFHMCRRIGVAEGLFDLVFDGRGDFVTLADRQAGGDDGVELHPVI